MSEKLPFMPWWIDRFFGSSKVRALPRGGLPNYIALLGVEWGEAGQGLPNNVEALADMIQQDPEQFKNTWIGTPERPGVCNFFVTGLDGRLRNERLEEVYKSELQRHLANVKKGQKGGVKSGEARLRPGFKPNASQRQASRVLKPEASIPSPYTDDEEPPFIVPHAEGDPEVELRRVQLEGQYDDGHVDLVKAIRRLGSCSVSKALELISGGFSDRDVFDWQAYAKVHGSKEAAIKLFAHVHVRDVPQEIKKPMGEWERRKSEEHQEALAEEARAQQLRELERDAKLRVRAGRQAQNGTDFGHERDRDLG